MARACAINIKRKAVRPVSNVEQIQTVVKDIESIKKTFYEVNSELKKIIGQKIDG
jgi:tetrahydromethanopterin S-methyltransferase subunit G